MRNCQLDTKEFSDAENKWHDVVCSKRHVYSNWTKLTKNYEGFVPDLHSKDKRNGVIQIMYGRGRPTSSRDKLIALVSFVAFDSGLGPVKTYLIKSITFLLRGVSFLGELCSKEREIRSQFTEGISYLMVVICCPVCCQPLLSNNFCMFHK